MGAHNYLPVLSIIAVVVTLVSAGSKDGTGAEMHEDGRKENDLRTKNMEVLAKEMFTGDRLGLVPGVQKKWLRGLGLLRACILYYCDGLQGKTRAYCILSSCGPIYERGYGVYTADQR